MPIPLPNLDDRTFADLGEEMRALVPRYAPTWTDHNVSDPGITVIELFAWLTEALLYRLNRIPEASVVRMLELLGATFRLARPATVTLNVAAIGLYEDLLLPQGTPLVASSGKGGGSIPFETLHDLALTLSQPTGVVGARQTALVQDEFLGKGDGRAYQMFSLQALVAAQSFLAGDTEGRPMISRLTVGGEPWTYKPSLLDLTVRDYTVESRLGMVRFGDGSLGRAPQEGQEIVASFRHTLGERGNLPAEAELVIDETSPYLSPQLRDALDSGVSISFVCQAKDPDGTDPARPSDGRGVDPVGLGDARDQVRTELRTRWRIITKEDFERVTLEQSDLKLARAKCLPELDLTAPDPYTPHTGHVSVIIVPESGEDKPEPSQECIDDVWEFLDQRRLIACRHHVIGPSYTDVALRAQVHRVLEVPAPRVLEMIEANLRGFFHPLTGGPGSEQAGWPFGRDVYASEIYEVLENTEGVDHVGWLTLYTRQGDGPWRDAGDWIVVDRNNLVHFVFDPSDIELRLVR